MTPLDNYQPPSCFTSNASCVRSKCFAIALLISSVVLGGGMAVFGGIGAFTSSSILHAVGTVGYKALFVSGGVLGIVGGIIGIVLLVKASHKVHGTQEQRPLSNGNLNEISTSPPLNESQTNDANESDQPPPPGVNNGDTKPPPSEGYLPFDVQDFIHLKKDEVNVRNINGVTPLLHLYDRCVYYAEIPAVVDRVAAAVITLLIAKGADIEIATRDGTPLALASRHGSVEAVKVLLEGGALVNAPDKFGRTPLHRATEYDDCGADQIGVITLLLKEGAAVNATDHCGSTPLHMAAISEGPNQVGVITLLLNAGAAVNATEHTGRTPLHMAAASGAVEIVTLLLNAGAAVDAKNKLNQTPLELTNNEQIRLLLEARMEHS